MFVSVQEDEILELLDDETLIAEMERRKLPQASEFEFDKEALYLFFISLKEPIPENVRQSIANITGRIL